MNNQNKTPRFKISAAVVRQLGDELVTDDVTAIMELIKNAYDADATWIKIEIETNSKLKINNLKFANINSSIVIEDNGFGMSKEDIINGWMYISVSQKREMKELGHYTPKGRSPLGDKGLGRLSTQRLGHYLELFTNKKNDLMTNHVAFDWDEFKDNMSLEEVPAFFEDIENINKSKSGTKLIISDLKDISIWQNELNSKFIGQLSQLIFPYKEKREFNIFLKINGIEIDLDNISDKLREQAISRFSFNYNNSMLSIVGKIKLNKLVGGSASKGDKEFFDKNIQNDVGYRFYKFLQNKEINKNYIDGIPTEKTNGYLFSFHKEINITETGGISYEQIDHSRIFANPGNFEGEIDEFSLKNLDNLDSVFDNLSQYKEIVKNQIGVRIFRNGFGIKPFGLDGEDWLKLGKSQTSGTFYGLRPNNVMGFVSITSDNNKNLIEKTDREGFQDNPYSQNFYLIMNKVVDVINDLLKSTRRSYNNYKKYVAEKDGDISSVNNSIKRIYNASEMAKNLKIESVLVSKRIDEVFPLLQKLFNESNIIGDIPDKIYNFENEIKLVLKQVNSLVEVAEKLKYDSTYIKPKIEDLEQQLGIFSELAGLGITAEALSHEIQKIVERIIIHTNQLYKKIKGKDYIEVTSVYTYLEYIKSSIRALKKELSHLAPSLNYVRENIDIVDIKKFTVEISDYYNKKYKNLIKVTPKYTSGSFSIAINTGKLTQIFDNIILNSEYWLKQTKKHLKINPNITIEINYPTVLFYDNGYGVDPSIEERIFQPFVTGKPRNIGRGLGLFIVQQLLDNINCNITLINELNAHNRRYKFQINFSSTIE